MASLSRDEWIKLHTLASDIWLLTHDKKILDRASQIMDFCEQVVGQLPRPDYASWGRDRAQKT